MTYTSANTFAGTNTFTYTVSDNYGGSCTNTITVAVAAQGDGFNQISAGPSGMTYAGIPGFSYALEYATTLTPPVVWTAGGYQCRRHRRRADLHQHGDGLLSHALGAVSERVT